MAKQKDYAISLCRFIALLLIIACHICQFYEKELAWWLNVGVQLFLIISGFLYGRRNKIQVADFYKKNLSKVLVDYYLYLIVIVPVHIYIIKYSISCSDYIKLILGLGTRIPGLGHLWFISTIVLCYLITPLLLPIMNKPRWLLYLCSAGVIIEIICIILPGLTGAWINCYIIGFVYGYLYRKNDFNDKTILNMLIFNTNNGTSSRNRNTYQVLS